MIPGPSDKGLAQRTFPNDKYIKRKLKERGGDVVKPISSKIDGKRPFVEENVFLKGSPVSTVYPSSEVKGICLDF